MNRLEFKNVRFLERQHGDAEERATFAEFELHAGGVCLSEVYDRGAQTTRPSIRGSLFHLVDWLLWNRWRLLYEPEVLNDPEWSMSHQLGAAGGGFLWPNLTFSSDGETVRLLQRADRSHQRMVRYLNAADVLVPLSDFEQAIDTLTELTLERLTSVGVRDAQLERLNQLVRSERSEPEAATFRRQEALLGLDPDELEAQQVHDLLRSAAWMGVHAADEVLSQARHEHANAAVTWLKDRSLKPDFSVNIAELLPFAADIELSPPALPWERGAALARRVRRGLGLGTDPLDLDALVHAPVSDGAARSRATVPLSAGFIQANTSANLGLALRRPSRSGRRFEVARIVGDALLRSPEDTVLPVTERATARQKVQRAFAQELLCPVEGLQKLLVFPDPTETELDDAADHYGVSQWTVRTALVNWGLVSRDYLPERAA